MKQPKVFGAFVKRGEHIFRTSAYIQWGDSDQSIGASLLLNPGSAKLDKVLINMLETVGSACGEIGTKDPTMEQLIAIVEEIYGRSKSLSGRFYIYNLFNLQNPKSRNAVDSFESLVETGEYEVTESLASLEELKSHPWILLGWGVNVENRWRNLELVKEEWRKLIKESKIPSYGKKHEERKDYYHPCPLISTHRPRMKEEIIFLFKQKFSIQCFPVHATKPNLIVELISKENTNLDILFGEDWQKSKDNPDLLVRSFSHLHIKSGYKLRAYQFSEGGNGNGVVWAIPEETELPNPFECEQYDGFFSAPKPPNALPDFMQAIEGDRTPLSYLQASIVFHELHEFGAMWHGISWARDVILPVEENSYNEKFEWMYKEEMPKIIEPHFYYSNEGNPIIVFHTINDIGTVTLNRYVHTFSKNEYSLEVERICLATASGGIIF